MRGGATPRWREHIRPGTTKSKGREQVPSGLAGGICGTRSERSSDAGTQLGPLQLGENGCAYRAAYTVRSASYRVVAENVPGSGISVVKCAPGLRADRPRLDPSTAATYRGSAAPRGRAPGSAASAVRQGGSKWKI